MDGARLGIGVTTSLPAAACVKVKHFFTLADKMSKRHF